MKTRPAKQAERHTLLRRGFLLSALGGLLCTAPLPIHAAEPRTENGRSIPDKVLLSKTSDCAGMIRRSVEEPMATFGRGLQGETFPHAAAAVSASGIQTAPTESVSDEKPSDRKIEVRFLVTREKQKTEGARITVVGTDQQTVTDAEGRARLFVDPGSTIRITYPGCQPQEEKIYNTFNTYRQLLLITLKPEDNSTQTRETQQTDGTGKAVEIHAPSRFPDGTSAKALLTNRFPKGPVRIHFPLHAHHLTHPSQLLATWM